MANATGIRRADDSLRANHGLAEAESLTCGRDRCEQLLATAAIELDRLYERVCESGCVLLLTDSDGTILHEKSNAMLKGTFRVNRVGGSLARSLVQERDPALAAYRASQHALTLEDLAGEDPQMLRNVRSAYRIADSGVSVLIQGPTGSGKEAFAHAMHLVSRRAERPFVAVNCAAIPETLIESELFGYKPGAFTGARKEGMRGKILQSGGGTLFLDEIGDMPLTLQTRLLRVLEEQEIVPLGSESAIKVDLHVIAASHRNLREMIVNGTFREDLYYRLNGARFTLPPLRERTDLDWLIRKLLDDDGVTLTPAARERLHRHAWPGNLRELCNVLRYARAVCSNGLIDVDDLPDGFSAPTTSAPAVPPPRMIEEFDPHRLPPEGMLLMQYLRAASWNLSAVARQIGVSRMTLYRRMARYGIKSPNQRDAGH
jgi:sigma-54 dependent transcriptional regulator, acetoin dehydrogenase operon transcriptional activator AcoR